MAIKYRCKCGRLYNLREELSGQLAKCAECRAVFRVPYFEPPAHRKPGEGFPPRRKPPHAQDEGPQEPAIAGVPVPEAGETPGAERGLDFEKRDFVLDLGDEAEWAAEARRHKPRGWLRGGVPAIATFAGLIVMLGSSMATVLMAWFVSAAYVHDRRTGAKPALFDCALVAAAMLVLNALSFLVGRIVWQGRRLGVYGLVGLMCVYLPLGTIAVMTGWGVYFSAGVLALVVSVVCLFPAAAISFAYWRRFE
jgi:uncharacterized membrane protein (DUF2068 family)